MSIKSYLVNLVNRLLNASELNTKIDRLAAQLQAVDSQEPGRQIAQLAKRIETIEYREGYVDKGMQVSLGIQYRQLLARGEHLSFEDVDFRNHSQTGEDGILWYIFSLVGTGSKKSIEICAGDGKECNTANLIVNHGWHSLLVDGNESKIEIAERYYRTHPGTRMIPPRIVCDWVTAENVNQLIESNGFSGDVDLLSLDMDGIDYWIWKAISVVSPRVVVVEIQAIWGSERAVTVPYRADFQLKSLGNQETGIAWYAGASLAAFVKLAGEKGYRLIGSNRFGFNVFFMREDVGAGVFPEISTEHLFDHPVVAWTNKRLRHLYDDDALEWIDV